MLSFDLPAKLTKIKDNFSPPHRIPVYEDILKRAFEAGYHFLTLGELARGEASPPQPFIILRHDIDTDPRAALDFASAEAALGVSASYFFRLRTWDRKIIDELHAKGHEIGYHYEESASYAKSRHLKTKDAVREALPAIRAEFASNLASLRKMHSFEISSFASHGDFANLVIDFGNYHALRDEHLRSTLGVRYEAYDHDLVRSYHNHVSDWRSPRGFNPRHPLSCVQNRENLLFLTHPRWWRVNPMANFRFDLTVWVERLFWKVL